MRRSVLLALLLTACPRSSSSSGAPTAEVPGQTAPQATAPAPQSSASPSAPAEDAQAAAAEYPIGRECATPEAIAREGKKLPTPADWKDTVAGKGRFRVRVPAGVFRASERDDGLRLVSSQKARTLGPDARERPFAIVLRRLPRSVDELLGDTREGSPMEHVYVEGAFPKRSSAGFVPHPHEPLGAGDAVATTIAGKPAFVWINGVEGYNSDYTLIALASRDTLFVVADWNSAIMEGQPECWQRAIIGGVVGSLTVDGVSSSGQPPN